MNKLDMAHEYAKIILERMLVGDTDTIGYNEIASDAYQLADAMKAEADKREPKGFPDVLQPEVDWRLAPEWANYYKTDGRKSVWITHDFEPAGGEIEPTYPIGFLWHDAPSFGFTESHVMERPQ